MQSILIYLHCIETCMHAFTNACLQKAMPLASIFRIDYIHSYCIGMHHYLIVIFTHNHCITRVPFFITTLVPRFTVKRRKYSDLMLVFKRSRFQPSLACKLICFDLLPTY